MRLSRKRLTVFTVVILWLLSINISNKVYAQGANLAVRVKVNPYFKNSRFIKVADFVNIEDRSMGMFTLFIRNLDSGQSAEQLYIGIKITSQKMGLFIIDIRPLTVRLVLTPANKCLHRIWQSMDFPVLMKNYFITGG